MTISDDPIAERVKSVIQPSVDGLRNPFDSDNVAGIYFICFEIIIVYINCIHSQSEMISRSTSIQLIISGWVVQYIISAFSIYFLK